MVVKMWDVRCRVWGSVRLSGRGVDLALGGTWHAGGSDCSDLVERGSRVRWRRSSALRHEERDGCRLGRRRRWRRRLV